VATATVQTEFTVMNIIELVATSALVAELWNCVQGLPVAVIAGDRCVCAIENKFCLRIVVKQPKVPVDRVMAQAALIAVPILMRVRVSVTPDTFCFCQFELVRFVAFLALHVGVFAE
jgi:hypothetical protein